VCDVPTCAAMVDAGRTLTWTGMDGRLFSVAVRVCAKHAEIPRGKLGGMLPGLPSTDSAYLDLRTKQAARDLAELGFVEQPDGTCLREPHRP
jgi:hypothetical protein